MLNNTVEYAGGCTIPEGNVDAATTPGSMLLLTRLSRVVYRQATEAVLGMTLKEYMALSILREQHNVTQQALGEALHLDPNNLVLLLNVLESGQLAERRRDSADRRRHIVELTSAGRVALERADRALESVEAQVLGGLSRDERRTLHQLLLRAFESSEKHSTQPVTASSSS
jgi:DNA-binding MarR family transcriptional regulator